MAHLIAGILLGIVLCADAGMVAFCVWYERHFPGVVDRIHKCQKRHRRIHDSTVL